MRRHAHLRQAWVADLSGDPETPSVSLKLAVVPDGPQGRCCAGPCPPEAGDVPALSEIGRIDSTLL